MLSQHDLHPEKLIVDEPAVATHKRHHVEDRPQLQKIRHCQNHQPMAHVTEHHPEKNGHSCEHEDGGQNLVVFGD